MDDDIDSYNRTILELKLSLHSTLNVPKSLIIAPFWN